MLKSVDYDIKYAHAGLEVLEDYLLSKDIFWPLGINPPQGEPSYPHLTLGWLLMAQARLAGREMTAEQESQVQQIESELNQHRVKWRVAWEKKARQCFKTRTRMWGEFLNEYKDSPQDNVDRYAYEVRLRVILELLRNEFELEDSAESQLLAGLDGYLRSVLKAGEFNWEPEVQRGFPPSEYWFLYGSLPETGGKR